MLSTRPPSLLKRLWLSTLRPATIPMSAGTQTQLASTAAKSAVRIPGPVETSMQQKVSVEFGDRRIDTSGPRLQSSDQIAKSEPQARKKLGNYNELSRSGRSADVFLDCDSLRDHSSHEVGWSFPGAELRIRLQTAYPRLQKPIFTASDCGGSLWVRVARRDAAWSHILPLLLSISTAMKARRNFGRTLAVLLSLDDGPSAVSD